MKVDNPDTGNLAAKSNTKNLDILLEKVYQNSRYDFRGYKWSTVTRRLERRLQATGTSTYCEYMRFLDAHPEEYERFAEYLTIKVSGFFRSQYAFKQIVKLVLPEMVSTKRDRGERSLRFWSTACARGEEPYSLAIVLAEFLGDQQQEYDISIYATDISQWALCEAQDGIYSQKDMDGLTDNTRDNHFVRYGEYYRVRDEIKSMLKFCNSDLASNIDPPFSGLDCIFCCNVLIYWQKQLQERVLENLYKALASPGYLVLGEVETLPSDFREEMKCLDRKARIYKKEVGKSANQAISYG